VCAIRVISYALTGNVNNCIKFIEAGGLKYIFPIFMGRGLPKLQHITKKNQMKSEYRLAEEMCITILSQLSIQANLINHQHELNQQELVGRILLKFYENEFEKLDRCIELFISYLNKVNMIDKQIEETIRRLEREDNDEALEEYASDENIMKMVSYALESRGQCTVIALAMANDLFILYLSCRIDANDRHLQLYHHVLFALLRSLSV
jgi:beta-catenin-like protein 1